MKNKKIVLVGNSPTILQSKMGNIIDQYDIVVRFNNYKVEGYEEHVGSKTDIWCIGNSKSIKPRRPSLFSGIWVKHDITTERLRLKFLGSPPMEKIAVLMNAKSHPKLFTFPNLGIWDNPSTGFSAIICALDTFGSDCNDVAIHGFSFFQETTGKNFRHYFGTDDLVEFYKNSIASGAWFRDELVKDGKEAIEKKLGVLFGPGHSGIKELEAIRMLHNDKKITILDENSINDNFLKKYRDEK